MASSRFLLAIIFSAALAGEAGSSSEPGSNSAQKQPPRFSIDVGAVALDVVVTDKKGKFVKGLKEEDFQVLEDGVPQELTFFTPEITPVSVLVLLDSSASVRANQRSIQKSANRFISKLRKGDQARIGFFHNEVVFGPRFTDDMDEHIAMINNMRPQRRTHLYDALLAGFEKLAEVRDRKTLLLFTDGDDEGSKATMEDTIEAARHSFVSIYTVGLLGWSFEEGMAINQDLLTQLSGQTGGRSFFPKNDKEMRKAFDGIREELHRQYRVAYLPANDQRPPGWHDVEVKLTKRKNLIVRTRLGYYSSPEKAP